MDAYLNTVRRAQYDANHYLADVYHGYKKGFSHDGTLKHIGEIYQADLVSDPDVLAVFKTDNKAEQLKYLKRYWDRHPECKVQVTK